MSEKIKISNKAADCLAWFAGHPFYADDLSEVIVGLTEEWFRREGKHMDSMIKGLYKIEIEGVGEGVDK
jgi:hypothetical protein